MRAFEISTDPEHHVYVMPRVKVQSTQTFDQKTKSAR